MSTTTPGWRPAGQTLKRLDSLVGEYRARVEEQLTPLVQAYYPSMMAGDRLEYRKLLELSSKMTIVGHACTRIAGYPFDPRRLRISGLFGACCFLGDSFLDDFGDQVAREYLARYELLLTQGWFEIRNDREELFYVTLARLFAERDVLDPMLRQAIFGLFLSQKRDVEMRSGTGPAATLPRRTQLRLLRECARDRSGHAITMLSLFLVPALRFAYHNLVYAAGSLIMHIDDHGDCHYDRRHNRRTYMNQLRRPVPALRGIFNRTIERIYRGLPASDGRDMLIAFLYRYYLTRLRKHRLEKGRGISWTVYE
jgi:hypothetical protein